MFNLESWEPLGSFEGSLRPVLRLVRSLKRVAGLWAKLELGLEAIQCVLWDGGVCDK